MSSDPVNHPAHYTSHPSGVEAITVCEHMPFNLGNAMKYLWRAGLKGSLIEDLKKAVWYINREIQKLEIGIPKELARLPLPVARYRTKSAKVRLIGNSVCPEVAEALVRANVGELAREVAA